VPGLIEQGSANVLIIDHLKETKTAKRFFIGAGMTMNERGNPPNHFRSSPGQEMHDFDLLMAWVVGGQKALTPHEPTAH
jgi:hypothetical protein